MVCGIVAEFNVFHNGHKYLIDKVREHSDAVVAVMSGSFVQRGDVAVTDKWSRAHTALLNGVDLVLELPVCYALNAAPNFAAGAVNTLGLLGVVDTLAFGSESGDIDELTKAADELSLPSDDVKKKLSDGLSYPAALSGEYGDALCKPNNILAIEYIRALKAYRYSIKPFTVKRVMTEHDSEEISENFSSASMIRKMIQRGEDISQLIPYSPDVLGAYPFLLSRLDSAFLVRLRSADANELFGISEVSEGLENRIIKAARETDTFEDLTHAVKSKRYTMSKIRRIIIASLLGFTKDIYSPVPEYIRVLGMNKKGAGLLKQAKKNCPVPIITKTADFKKKSRILELEIRASDISALCCPDAKKRMGGADFTHSPVIMGG